MDSEEFKNLLRDGQKVKLNRDIPEEALKDYSEATKMSDRIEILKRHGLTELEIGSVIGYDKGHQAGCKATAQGQGTPQQEAGMMFG